MRCFTTLYLVFIGLLLLGVGTLLVWDSLPNEEQEEESATGYSTQFVGAPGVNAPTLVPGSKAKLADDVPVFGIVVDGQARAYQKSAFEVQDAERELGRNVVNDLVGRQPVTIAHCDRHNCTKVFLGYPSNKPLDAGVFGWDADKGMIIVIKRDFYPLESSDIPLKQLDFEEITWGEWLQAHPDTKVYLKPDSKPRDADRVSPANK